jgi:hypothetical protein
MSYRKGDILPLLGRGQGGGEAVFLQGVEDKGGIVQTLGIP